LSKDYARSRASTIDPSRANSAATAGTLPAHGGDTTYLSVVDRLGNMVSLIQSNFASFGSGVVPDGAGFALQNRGGLFTLDPRHPNVLAPRKRPLHTIIPGFMSKGDLRTAFGIMGGWNQSQAHAQFIADLVDYKMNIQAALEPPPFPTHPFTGCDFLMENRFPGKVVPELTAKGHKIQIVGTFSAAVGGGQAVQRDFAT